MPGKKWPILLAVCVLGIVLVVIAFAARLAESKAQESTAQKEVQERLAALRQAGQPISFQDLAVRYPDPPSEHDAELLLKPAVTAFVEPKDSENLPCFGGDWPALDAPLSPQLLASLRAALEENKNALDLVPGDELKSAWAGFGFTKGMSSGDEISLSGISSLTRLFCLDAVLKSVTVDSSGARKSLEKSLLIARTFKNDTILHGLMKMSMCKRGCESLNQILNRAEMSDSDLRTLAGLMPVLNAGGAKEMFINERAFGVGEAEELRSAAEKDAAAHRSPKFVYLNQDLLEYLDRADSIVAAADLPLSNAIPKLIEMEKREKIREDQIKASRSSFMGKFFRPRLSLASIIAFANFSNLLIQETKGVAYERAALTAIAIERYRLSHAGRLPENLSALVPEYLASVPKDPFDDRELRFEKLERGYAVYSVGPDFTDDNGEPEPKEAKNAKHYDVVFSVAR